MKPATGHIKLARKYFASEEWLQPRVFSRQEAWIDLIQMAQWQDKVFQSKRYGSVELKRGEFVGSVRRLGKRWSWSHWKVEGFLKAAQKTGRISSQRTGRYGTVYLVDNYDSYQAGPQKNRTPNRTPTLPENRTSTSKEHISKAGNTEGAGAPAPEPSSLDRLPKSTVDSAFQTWGERLGVVNYGRLRKTLLECVDAGYDHTLLPGAVDAYADVLETMPEREKGFNAPTPERFAQRLAYYVKLGQQGYGTGDRPTERGLLFLRGIPA